MPPERRSVAAAWAVALLLALPVRAAAQKSAFIDAFIDFHSALPGPYGDEGPRVTAALDRMAASLDSWERTSGEAEAALRARAGTTPADLALLYADQQRLDEAIDAIQLAIAAEPRRASYLVLQGLLDQAAGHSRAAGAAYDAAHALDPADPIAAYLSAAHLADDGGGDEMKPLVATLMAAAERGRLQPAPFARFALVDDLWAATPIFSPAAYADGFASMAAGRFREALERFRAAVARDPLVTDPAGRTPRVLAGIAALRDRRGSEAIRELEAAAAALPTSPEANRALGVAYRAVGRLPESIAQFETAVRLATGDARARIALGTTLMEAGRLDDAERALRETLEILPASGEARWALADVYERLDRGMDAVASLEAAASLTVIAGKAHLYWRIAQLVHGYQRDFPRVIAVVSRRTWLALNEPNAHKDLGMAYQRAGRTDEALVELLMAALLGYEDGEMLGAMGQIHLAAGRLDKAEVTLRRAVALAPELPQPRYALGSTLRRLGRIEEATEQLETFRRLQTAAFEAERRGFEIDAAVHEAAQLARTGRLVEAAAAYEKAGTLGAPADIYRELAAIYAKLGRSEDGARALAAYEARRK
jgi:tetratricopeptide (TPR) repeat protein